MHQHVCQGGRENHAANDCTAMKPTPTSGPPSPPIQDEWEDEAD